LLRCNRPPDIPANRHNFAGAWLRVFPASPFYDVRDFAVGKIVLIHPAQLRESGTSVQALPEQRHGDLDGLFVSLPWLRRVSDFFTRA
jgi:hypothetical protein